MTDYTEYIRTHRTEDVRRLALSAQKELGDDLSFVLRQIAGWQMARTKLPSWAETEGILYPVHLSMEQCSSEQTARYKASLMRGRSLVDLTGGFGVDFSFAAKRFQSAIVVERNPDLCNLLRVNLPLLQVEAEVVCADAVEFLRQMSRADCIYIDPARRDENGKKTVSVEDCSPNLMEINSLLLDKSKEIWVKYSPMLDLSQVRRSLRGIAEIHVVAVENECKELLLRLSLDEGVAEKLVCVNLTKKGTEQFVFSMEEERSSSCLLADEVGEYLYEPNVALLKAGAYKVLTERYGVRKLDVNSHLYTSQDYVSDFSGRRFRVSSVFSMNKTDIKENISYLRQANVAVRNFPMTVAELRSRYKIKEGGGCYLFATTMRGKHLLIACEKCE